MWSLLGCRVPDGEDLTFHLFLQRPRFSGWGGVGLLVCRFVPKCMARWERHFTQRLWNQAFFYENVWLHQGAQCAEVTWTFLILVSLGWAALC